jgi:hypothetical protein
MGGHVIMHRHLVQVHENPHKQEERSMHHELAARTAPSRLPAINITRSFLITANAIRNRRNSIKTKDGDAF